MKSLLSLIVLSVLMLTASCTVFQDKVVPAAKKLASEKVTSAIVKTGQCSNVEAVKADVDGLFKIESDTSLVVSAIAEAPAPVVAKSFSGNPIVSSICKSAVSLALPPLLKKGVPAAWGCTLVDVSAQLESIALDACSKI